MTNYRFHSNQEKVRKVLEIWKKSNTFPSTTLSTLTARLETAIARNPSENGNGSIVVASGSKSDGVASSTKMEKEQMRKVETIKGKLTVPFACLLVHGLERKCWNRHLAQSLRDVFG